MKKKANIVCGDCLKVDDEGFCIIENRRKTSWRQFDGLIVCSHYRSRERSTIWGRIIFDEYFAMVNQQSTIMNPARGGETECQQAE